NGYLDGMCYDYYESGQIKKEYQFNSRVKVGHWKHYYPTGGIDTEIIYSTNNRNEIKETSYYENGNIESFFSFDPVNIIRVEYFLTQNGDTLLWDFPIDTENRINLVWEKNDTGQIVGIGKVQYDLI